MNHFRARKLEILPNHIKEKENISHVDSNWATTIIALFDSILLELPINKIKTASLKDTNLTYPRMMMTKECHTNSRRWAINSMRWTYKKRWWEWTKRSAFRSLPNQDLRKISILQSNPVRGWFQALNLQDVICQSKLQVDRFHWCRKYWEWVTSSGAFNWLTSAKSHSTILLIVI